ncbi:SymE family type I addiction module toxin [Marinomonas sp. THO17]|uniref:SymE family type I addiction module toxin n=1 Tax=Marinomonas sp. THO17 TaxID=3149048 RepID=UPI00336BE35F
MSQNNQSCFSRNAIRYKLNKTRLTRVHSTAYPPLKNGNGAGAWRKISWINLRGFWLERAGSTIGTTYTITAYNKQLIFTAE